MLPLVTALVSGAFAVAVALQYLRKRRPPQLAWAIGLSLFTLAAFMGFLARSGGATDVEYRLFYLFGAITNVAWLALGTIYIVAPRFGRAALAVVLGLSAVAIYAVFAAPVDIAVGVFIVAAGGTVAFTGASGILELTNLLGVSVMFVGFLLA